MKLAPVLLALLAVAAPALAQTGAHAISGDYDDVYVITGRALDAAGRPFRGGILTVSLDQEGVVAEPLRAAANCKGDFITSFTLRKVSPEGRATITLLDEEGRARGSTTVALDPFYRRSAAIVRYEGDWNNVCTREIDVWDVSASLSLRVVNRTNESYTVEDATYYARPYNGYIRMRYEPPNGAEVCPPDPQAPGACEQFVPDERGDVRYTFTLDQPFEGGGQVRVSLFHTLSSLVNRTPDVEESIPIDPETRISFRNIEVSGRGAPPEIYETPAAAPLALVAVIAALALLARPKRR